MCHQAYSLVLANKLVFFNFFAVLKPKWLKSLLQRGISFYASTLKSSPPPHTCGFDKYYVCRSKLECWSMHLIVPLHTILEAKSVISTLPCVYGSPILFISQKKPTIQHDFYAQMLS